MALGYTDRALLLYSGCAVRICACSFAAAHAHGPLSSSLLVLQGVEAEDAGDGSALAALDDCCGPGRLQSRLARHACCLVMCFLAQRTAQV